MSKHPWDSYNENGKWAWKEPSFIIVFMYYFLRKHNNFFWRTTLSPFYFFLSIFTGINIPRSTQIGEGLRIHHYGCIIINSHSIIGKNCKIRHGVTIGNKNSDDDCPTIGDHCNIGAGAKILGKIKIGNNVDIGANAVVVKDVPDNCIVAGIPATVIKSKK